MNCWRIFEICTETKRDQQSPFGKVAAGARSRAYLAFPPGIPNPPKHQEDDDECRVAIHVATLADDATEREAADVINQKTGSLHGAWPEFIEKRAAGYTQRRGASRQPRAGKEHAEILKAFRDYGGSIPNFAATYGVEVDGDNPLTGELRQRNGRPYRVKTLRRFLYEQRRRRT